KYSYRAINQKGRPVRGVISAANESDLFNRLQTSSLSLLDAKELNEKNSKWKAVFSPKVKTRDLIQMFVHLEQLQKAGVPLLDALSDVRDTADSTRLRDVMSDVFAAVSSGSSLSDSLSQHQAIFEPIFISLIASGEET